MTDPVHNKKTAKNMPTIITFYSFSSIIRINSLLQTHQQG